MHIIKCIVLGLGMYQHSWPPCHAQPCHAQPYIMHNIIKVGILVTVIHSWNAAWWKLIQKSTYYSVVITGYCDMTMWCLIKTALYTECFRVIAKLELHFDTFKKTFALSWINANFKTHTLVHLLLSIFAIYYILYLPWFLVLMLF